MTAKPNSASQIARLQAYRQQSAATTIAHLFDADAGRFAQFSAQVDDLLYDYSKTHLTAELKALLIDLARTADVEGRRAAMATGEKINTTEQRAVLHMALRGRADRPIRVDGRDVMPDVIATLDRFLAFADRVRDGTIATADGRRFTDVVSIGIGGSDLGPAMAAGALTPYRGGGPATHFVSNVDGADLADTLEGLDLATTLFVVVSKTFTTQETMANARSARAMVADVLGPDAVAAHFAAVSTNKEAVAQFGIAADRLFGFWDWVGGRFSVWSAVGLSLAIAIGGDQFRAFLAGARAMDEHFLAAPLDDNLPVLMALTGYWHRSICGHASLAIVPYDQRLARLPAYLQQLEMESNGKSVTGDGRPVSTATAPVVWGEPGTNGQHAFFQLLHQGTDIIPCDFLIAAEPSPALGDHHAMLTANCLAQARALMVGRDLNEARAQLRAQGMSAERSAALAPHRVCTGNRPSCLLAYRTLDPRTLGLLLALYEHKTFVQGVLWGINSFDQFGVELGKEMAGELLPELRGAETVETGDSSTAGIMAHLETLRSR